eukprot:398493_1
MDEKKEAKQVNDWTSAWKMSTNVLENNTNDCKEDWKSDNNKNNKPITNIDNNQQKSVDFNFKWNYANDTPITQTNIADNTINDKPPESFPLPIEPSTVQQIDDADNNNTDDAFMPSFIESMKKMYTNTHSNNDVSENEDLDLNNNNTQLNDQKLEQYDEQIAPIRIITDEKSEHKNDENNLLTSFIDCLKKRYVISNEPLDDEEKETQRYEQHNEFMQHLLDAATQIQLWDKLSYKQKLKQKQLIANTIQIEDHKIKDPFYSGMDGDVPAELKKVIDGSVVIESALKKYRPSMQQVTDFISSIHSGKLDVSNPMHIVMYSMQHFIKHKMLVEIYNAYAIVAYSLELTLCGKSKGNNGESEEDKEKRIDKEVEEIVQLIMTNVFNNDSKSVKRPLGSSMYVRFDGTYKHKRYFIDNLYKNVYCGKLKFGQDLGVGDNYRIDCGGDLFAVCGGTGWKYRDPAMISCFIDTKTHIIKHIYGNRGFSSPGQMLYCDTYHNRIWNSGDHRIKSSGIIDTNGKDTYCEKVDCEYILNASKSGILFSTLDKMFIFCSNGIFYSWTMNKLSKHKTDYYTNCCDDDEIPEMDENGINTQQYAIFENTSSDLECVEVEVSGGEKYHDSFEINTDLVMFKYASLSIVNNVESKVYITNNNAIYSYDMNKNMFDGMLLGHNGDSHIPFRQNIIESHNLLISNDYDMVKIWDIRDFQPKITINACGFNNNLNSCVAFNVSGNVFIASGGGDEAVTIWDIRKVDGALYEISTGNNNVNQIIWHENSQSLFISTECEYVDRLGGKYYGTSLDPTSTFYDSDEQENDWPSRAVHRKDGFPICFDSGANQVFRCKF